MFEYQGKIYNSDLHGVSALFDELKRPDIMEIIESAIDEATAHEFQCVTQLEESLDDSETLNELVIKIGAHILNFINGNRTQAITVLFEILDKCNNLSREEAFDPDKFTFYTTEENDK